MCVLWYFTHSSCFSFLKYFNVLSISPPSASLSSGLNYVELILNMISPWLSSLSSIHSILCQKSLTALAISSFSTTFLPITNSSLMPVMLHVATCLSHLSYMYHSFPYSSPFTRNSFNFFSFILCLTIHHVVYFLLLSLMSLPCQ